MKENIIGLALFTSLSSALMSQEYLKQNEKPIQLDAFYTGDNLINLTGGIKTGYAYLGLANFMAMFDIEQAGLWKGGELFINAANTHGAVPSTELIGDKQFASNIEAGNHTFLQEIWFKQKIGKVDIILGLQDMNVEFAITENGLLFLNGSFGILPVISNNINVPVFPLTSLGISLKWNISEKVYWLNAIYDGCPTDFENNLYNITWQFNPGDGLLAISEFQYYSIQKSLSSSYKIGLFSHSHIAEETLDIEFPDSLARKIYGIYLITDHILWKRGNKTLGVFSQIGFSPSASCVNDFYIGLGVNYKGIFCKNDSDAIGLAIACEHFNNNLKTETAIELSYQYQINENLFVQPDVQYIIRPAGTGVNLNNCVVGFLRLGICF